MGALKASIVLKKGKQNIELKRHAQNQKETFVVFIIHKYDKWDLGFEKKGGVFMGFLKLRILFMGF